MIKYDWYQQAIATEVKIKDFFGITAANQRKLIISARVIEDHLNLQLGGGNDGNVGAANNDDGGCEGDINDGRDIGGNDEAIVELNIAV